MFLIFSVAGVETAKATILNIDFEGPDGSLGGTHTTYTGLGLVGTGTYWNSVGIFGASAGSLFFEDGTSSAANISISDTQQNSYSQSVSIPSLALANIEFSVSVSDIPDTLISLPVVIKNDD